MASLVASSMRRRLAPRDLEPNVTLVPFHHPNNPNLHGHHVGFVPTATHGNNGQDLDAVGTPAAENNKGQGGSGGGSGNSDGKGNGGGDGGHGGGGNGGSSGGGDNDNQSGHGGDGQGGNSGSSGDDGDGGGNGGNPHGGGFNECGASMKGLMPDPKLCQAVNENDGRLKYGSGWQLSSSDPNGIVFTAHTTTVSGSSVVVDWEGTSIIVFGTVPQSNASSVPPSATYSIDNKRPVSLTLPSSDRCIPNQQFFQSPTIAPGTHNLTINVTTPDGTPYVLDYLWFCGPLQSGKSLNSTGVDDKRPSHGGLSRLDGIILGSVLGGFIFLLGVAALVWACLRRRRRRQQLRKLHIAASPVSSWLHWQSRSGTRSEAAFTSTESILRDNPSYSSTAGSKETKRREVVSMPISTVSSPQSPELPPGLRADGLRSLGPPPWTVYSRTP
ncbi:hypothetical protein BV20DRAFT_188313 [Pilatotrama ljubarskyi]|nr:hypothetical protein BV20DRAFT_188313 [Pilatotrama ljubarskyi]